LQQGNAIVRRSEWIPVVSSSTLESNSAILTFADGGRLSAHHCQQQCHMHRHTACEKVGGTRGGGGTIVGDDDCIVVHKTKLWQLLGSIGFNSEAKTTFLLYQNTIGLYIVVHKVTFVTASTTVAHNKRGKAQASQPIVTYALVSRLIWWHLTQSQQQEEVKNSNNRILVLSEARSQWIDQQ
jgi:hypothetical protein